MTAVSVPSLAGLAKLAQVADRTDHANVGAAATGTIYTVATGRAAWITSAMIAFTGGTAPTALELVVKDSGGTEIAQLVLTATVTAGEGVFFEGAVFLHEGDFVEYQITGGDGTTDLATSVGGGEFDWYEV